MVAQAPKNSTGVCPWRIVTCNVKPLKNSSVDDQESIQDLRQFRSLN
jgi:hypothetical protein